MSVNLPIGAIHGVIRITGFFLERAIALQTSPRVFHFSKQAAIANFPTPCAAPSAKQ
jgi:hypothetical protein